MVSNRIGMKLIW